MSFYCSSFTDSKRGIQISVVSLCGYVGCVRCFYNMTWGTSGLVGQLVHYCYAALDDFVFGGEGYGPIYTDPVEMNLFVSSTDAVAIDAVCSKIMGIEPFEVPITRLGHAEGIGVGNMEQIEVKGESIEDVMK